MGGQRFHILRVAFPENQKENNVYFNACTVDNEGVFW